MKGGSGGMGGMGRAGRNRYGDYISFLTSSVDVDVVRIFFAGASRKKSTRCKEKWETVYFFSHFG